MWLNRDGVSSALGSREHTEYRSDKVLVDPRRGLVRRARCCVLPRRLQRHGETSNVKLLVDVVLLCFAIAFIRVSPWLATAAAHCLLLLPFATVPVHTCNRISRRLPLSQAYCSEHTAL